MQCIVASIIHKKMCVIRQVRMKMEFCLFTNLTKINHTRHTTIIGFKFGKCQAHF